MSKNGESDETFQFNLTRDELRIVTKALWCLYAASERVTEEALTISCSSKAGTAVEALRDHAKQVDRVSALFTRALYGDEL